MTQTFRLPIVGLWFKPPASKLVKLLALDTKLELAAEPHNPIDSNAVAVWLPIAQLRLRPENERVSATWSDDFYRAFHDSSWLSKVKPGETIQAETYEDFRVLAAFQLGYISAANAALLVVRSDWPGSADGKLRFDPKGKPEVEFSLGDAK